MANLQKALSKMMKRETKGHGLNSLKKTTVHIKEDEIVEIVK